MRMILKLLLTPISWLINLIIWACAGMIYCSSFIFKIASSLLSILAVAVLVTYSVKNGIILLIFAFLISPMGLPMMAVHLLSGLGRINSAIRRI